MSSTEKVKAKIAEAQDIFPTNKVITIENLKEWLEQKKRKHDQLQFLTKSPKISEMHYWKTDLLRELLEELSL